ncbi:uncharacterized protein LOC121633739 [Melanotaenia boesemani]|uniref:uncharacterized protein LOC121633739 n=1 Tax=Melanotaenia boesemani TaxID=1250792 RepID=UPI001C0555DC|nr:uncharacterized protein LOC121633739 [Melanotaenia boesemani]
MHWLPLVAMVIASALPFPHNPVSSAAVTITQPDSDHHREQRRDPAVGLATPPVDYNLRGNASQTDHNRQNLHNQKDYAQTSTFKLENQITYQSQLNSDRDDKTGVIPAEEGAFRTEDISEDNFLPNDYKANSRSRQDYSKYVDFSKDTSQDSTVQNHDFVSPATILKGQGKPEPSQSSEDLRHAPTIMTKSQGTLGTRTGPTEESLNMGAGQRVRMDSLLEGNELFLNAHPRVLFSPSSLPPEDPPLLLMLESGLLEEDGNREEQEDTYGHIEGHGDHAIDRSYSKVNSKEAVHHVKRDKRSHLMDRRRGEKSVCESVSVWVTDKETATDSEGKNVTVLKEIQTQAGPIKQFFFETRCVQAEQQHSDSNRTKGAVVRPVATGLAGAGCLGVDKKQWVSECKPKKSFVRALTKDANNKTGWRWIRIDSSCVCVLLSRTNQGRRVMPKKGRG